MLEVHEDFRPRKRALGDQAVEKCSAIAALHIIGHIEKCLEIGSLGTEPIHVALQLRLLGAGYVVRTPDAVSMPRENDHGNQSDAAHRGSAHGDTAVTFDGGSFLVYPNFHTK